VDDIKLHNEEWRIRQREYRLHSFIHFPDAEAALQIEQMDHRLAPCCSAAECRMQQQCFVCLFVEEIETK